MRLGVTIAVSLLTALAAACSGPNTQAWMNGTQRYAEVSIGIIAICLIVTVVLMRRAREQLLLAPLVLGLLIPSHPRWFTSVSSGDCGMFLMMTTSGVNLLAALLTAQHIVGVRRILKAKRRP